MQAETQAPLVEGSTPGNVILDSIVPYPTPGQSDAITLRNIGGKSVNISSWVLSDAEVDGANALVFGSNPDCMNITMIAPAEALVLQPYNAETNICGFKFGVSYRCVRLL